MSTSINTAVDVLRLSFDHRAKGKHKPPELFLRKVQPEGRSRTSNVGNAGFWFMDIAGKFEVTGNVSAGGGFPADFTLQGNRVGKDLVFSDNVGPSELTENYAQKDLECSRNDPAPIGWGNSAGKGVEGQCAHLTGPPPE